MLSHSVVSDSVRPYGLVARQAPLSMGFSRQEYWSGLPFLTSPNWQFYPYSNPMDRGAWRATVHGVAKESDTNLGTKQQQNFVPVYLFFLRTSGNCMFLNKQTNKNPQNLNCMALDCFYSFGQYPNYKKYFISYFLLLKYTSLFNKLLIKYILKQQQYIYPSPRKSVMFLFGILLK